MWGLSFSNWAGTYVECPLHGRNLFREQDDIEGIHLRLREAVGPIPRTLASRADVFRSSVRHCIIELRISQDRLLLGPAQQTVTIAGEKQAELGFPTAAGDRRRLGVTAETRQRRSYGGGSDPGPLSSP